MEERQTPKCFRQIGQGAEREHIYIEDYVKSYFTRECEERLDDGCVLALFGTAQRRGKVREWYIEGAGRLPVGMNSIYPGVEEEVRRGILELHEQHFSEMQFVGWFFRMPAVLPDEESLYETLSREWFPEQELCFLTYRLFDGLLHVYMVQRDAFFELPGYYIYYEKNVPMQDYMVEQQENAARRERPREAAVEAIRARFREEEAKELEANAGGQASAQRKKNSERVSRWQKKAAEKALQCQQEFSVQASRPQQESSEQVSQRHKAVEKPGRSLAVMEGRISEGDSGVAMSRRRWSRLSVATMITTLTFLALLATFLYLQYDNIDQVVEAVQTFAKSIGS